MPPESGTECAQISFPDKPANPPSAHALDPHSLATSAPSVPNQAPDASIGGPRLLTRSIRQGTCAESCRRNRALVTDSDPRGQAQLMFSVELRVAEEAGFDVYVRVLQAEGLPPMERGGGCNALVQGESGDQVRATSVQWRTRSPVWPPRDVGEELLFKDITRADEVLPVHHVPDEVPEYPAWCMDHLQRRDCKPAVSVPGQRGWAVEQWGLPALVVACSVRV